MAELYKTRIKQLDYKSDYTLFLILGIASISSNGLDMFFVPTKTNGELLTSKTTVTGCEATAEDCEQASRIIVCALSDDSLRVVLFVIGNPIIKMETINDR